MEESLENIFESELDEESEKSNVFLFDDLKVPSYEFSFGPSEESEGPKTLEPGVVTEQHLKDISLELGLIKLCWPPYLQDHEPEERIYYPPSYLTNNKKETLLLWYAENFRQQFNFKYPKRRPLLIACDNECGIQKMVCTTIRPTTMKFTEFRTWQGCASFVSEYLTFEELASPTLLAIDYSKKLPTMSEAVSKGLHVLHLWNFDAFKCANRQNLHTIYVYV